VCGRPLEEISRVPVCRSCLTAPAAFEAEFFCASCRTPFRNAFPLDEKGRCALCRNGLRSFDAAYCFGSYEGVLRKLIQLYKYGKVRSLAAPLSAFLLRALPRDEQIDVVLPVPLHWHRRWQRGFNQAELIAGIVARRRGVRLAGALRRVRATESQAGLSNTSRRRNLAGAFRCRQASVVAGGRVLLIDDVLTTGSTAAACAQALKRAGAARVVVLTIARVDRRFDGPRGTTDSMTGGAI
jgi:ComF family protein